MKKVILIVVLIVMFIGLATSFYLSPNSALAHNALDATQLLQMQNNLRSHVDFLTQISPARTSENLDSLNKVADYIYKNLTTSGFKPEYQSYEVQVGSQKRIYHNIIAHYGDPQKPRIVIGAHYDARAEKVGSGSPPGADDNASGVAGLLELARIIQQTSPLLANHSIEFVAYSLEEPPYFRTLQMGSYVHAQSLHEKNIDVKLMVSLEMIGYFSDEPGSQQYPFDFPMKPIYGDKGNFIALIGNPESLFILNKVQKLFGDVSSLPINKLGAPTRIQGIDWSDHLNYWKFDYPAIMLTDTSFLRNKNYHQITDTADTLDYAKMAQIVIGMQAVLLDYH